jgi:hypothetical protein
MQHLNSDSIELFGLEGENPIQLDSTKPGSILESSESSRKKLELWLEEMDIPLKRCSNRVGKGTKACYDHDNLVKPTETEGSYAVFGGNRLGFWDVDVPLTEVPEFILNHTDTFVVKTPHDGVHIYVALEGRDISGTKINSEEGTEKASFRVDQLVIGPGSTINHAKCDDEKNCPEKGSDSYDIVKTGTETPSEEYIDKLREITSNSARVSNGSRGSIDSDKDPDETIVEAVESVEGSTEGKKGTMMEALGELKDDNVAVFNMVMDLLRGGIDDREGLMKSETKVDRSAADMVAVSTLYQVLRKYTDLSGEELHQTVYMGFNHFVEAKRGTEPPEGVDPEKFEHEPRKWRVRGQGYRELIMTYAYNQADYEKFERIVEHKGGDGWRQKLNEYSNLTYRSVGQALDELLPDRVRAAAYRSVVSDITTNTLSNDTDPESPDSDGDLSRDNSPNFGSLYPGADEIANRAKEIDEKDNSTDSYKSALYRLKKYGVVNLARIGDEYVYYPANHPDPLKANYVKSGGEKRDPDPKAHKLEYDPFSEQPERDDDPDDPDPGEGKVGWGVEPSEDSSTDSAEVGPETAKSVQEPVAVADGGMNRPTNESVEATVTGDNSPPIPDGAMTFSEAVEKGKTSKAPPE